MLTRLYADEAGESHFEDVALTTDVGVFGSARSVSAIAAPIPSLMTTIREVREEGPLAGVWHPNPRRRLEFFPTGLCEIEASDGETRRFGAGERLFLLGEDTHGKGHLFRPLAGPRTTIFIDLPDDWQP
jgi:hypothetical protein